MHLKNVWNHKAKDADIWNETSFKIFIVAHPLWPGIFLHVHVDVYDSIFKNLFWKHKD